MPLTYWLALTRKGIGINIAEVGVDFSYFYFLMNILSIELGLTSVMPLVARAYLGLDDTTVVVELHTDPTAGLPVENLLFFSAEDFSADKVKVAIAKLLVEYASAGS